MCTGHESAALAENNAARDSEGIGASLDHGAKESPRVADWNDPS